MNVWNTIGTFGEPGTICFCLFRISHLESLARSSTYRGHLEAFHGMRRLSGVIAGVILLFGVRNHRVADKMALQSEESGLSISCVCQPDALVENLLISDWGRRSGVV